MNFFEYQERARQWTHWLVVLYILAVALTVLAVYTVVIFVFHIAAPALGFGASHSGVYSAHVMSYAMGNQDIAVVKWWNPEWFYWSAGITLLVLLGGTVYKIVELSGGGAVVACLMGGTPVSGKTTDPDEQRLRNVVEEMAIASGVPVPQIFVMHDERGINAFAAGHTTHDAVITVTHGALHHLTREELQGVIGHEFSHILNGDMRMNIRLMGILNGLLVIALTGYTLVRVMGRAMPRRGKGAGAVMAILLFGVLIMIVGYVGVFFANLIKAAIGREREYLADAASAQFTRNPMGLANALKKIAALAAGSTIEAPEAAQTSHFFIAEPGVTSWLNFLATHPPLDARILRLDPTYTGDLTEVHAALHAEMSAERPPLPQSYPPVHPMHAATNVGKFADRVGAPDFQSITYAAALLNAIPDACRRVVGDTNGAQTVLFCLVLSDEQSIRSRQMAFLADNAPSDVFTRISFLGSNVPPASRLPLADLAISTLRRLSPDRYSVFRKNLSAVLAADSAGPNLFNFMLLHMVTRRLDRHFGLTPPVSTRYSSLDSLQDDIAAVFSALAWGSTDQADMAARAYARSWQALSDNTNPVPSLCDRADCAWSTLDQHLERLAQATPALKARVLTACSACVTSNSHTTLREAEILRAIADGLDCPVPPFAPDMGIVLPESTCEQRQS